MKQRCSWANKTELEVAYHDTEWGVPLYDDQALFELLTLEGAQSGLSWSTILAKREGYQAAFDQFDIEKVAEYSEKKIAALIEDTRIVRHKLKIRSTVNNAQAIVKIQEKHGNFSSYIWSFVNEKPIQNKWKELKNIPVKTALSDQMSKQLKKDGFKFVGSTTCYAFMQAAGLVNDHLVSCFRYEIVRQLQR